MIRRRLNVSKKTKANRIFEKWKVDFVKMDKKRENMRENFDQLFYSLYAASIPYDIAREIVDDAVGYSLPSHSTAKYVWKVKKPYVKTSYKEWLDGWKDDIRNKALAAYYELYPIEEKDILPPPLPTKKTRKTQKGIATDDELNEEDFYNSSKKVTRENPFFFTERGDS